MALYGQDIKGNIFSNKVVWNVELDHSGFGLGYHIRPYIHLAML